MNNMEIIDEINKKENLHPRILDFIDEKEDKEEKYYELIEFVNESKISQNKQDLQDILYLLLNISNNHHRESDFINKMIRILQFLQTDLNEFFTNDDIYKIFEPNMLLIFHLIQNELITPNDFIIRGILDKRPNRYFLYPVIKSYINEIEKKNDLEKQIKTIQDSDLTIFQTNCERGENDSEICCLIRDDSIDEFIAFFHRKNLVLNSKIKPSIFETNDFLKDKSPTLIEYAAFYGSIQIFDYLCLNKIEFKKSVMIYAIHGRNYDMIHSIEGNIKINDLEDKFFYTDWEEISCESIKCHHNDFANYIINNYINKNSNGQIFNASLKYHNYAFVQNDEMLKISYDDLSEYSDEDLLNFAYNNSLKISYEKLCKNTFSFWNGRLFNFFIY
ncbi:hypothetical protein M9Y10_039919 [Tritrichomonas musculus]|uniref:DUF3447 domain-containing protein n=1 Tax=Tritrichomonas musculus TaxID=1915356 RepID=A0ABR2GQT0_9EUKA